MVGGIGFICSINDAVPGGMPAAHAELLQVLEHWECVWRRIIKHELRPTLKIQ